jgi:hypothetical protein
MKNLKFALALALTRTAKAAQAEVIRQLPERFTIRTTWVKRGIRIIPATKKRLQSSVIVKDDFMIRQEEGGEKRSLTGHAVAIPVAIRASKRSVTRPSRYPGALLDKPRHFLAPFRSDPSTRGLFRRRGKKSLTLLYILKDSVDVPARFEFEETVGDVAAKVFGKELDKAVDVAFKPR